MESTSPRLEKILTIFVLYQEGNIKMDVDTDSLASLKKKIALKLKIDDDFRLEYYDENFSEFASLKEMKNLLAQTKPKVRVTTFVRYAWQYSLDFLENEKWEMQGGKNTPFRKFNIVNNSEVLDPVEYRKVKDILKKYGGEKIGKITDVIALQNDGLEKAFSFYNNSLIEKFRSSPQIFRKENWKKHEVVEDRQFVHDNFIKMTKKYDTWTEDKTVPIIPMFQGTAKSTYLKIAQTGFCTVATLDDGFYGRGIYFTSSINYASYYSLLSMKGNTTHYCIIIAFVSPGNIYPVIESPTGKQSFRGKAGVINPGYQSHYVNVWNTGSGKTVGYPCPKGTAKGYTDELVIFQDAQALPKYILTIEK